VRLHETLYANMVVTNASRTSYKPTRSMFLLNIHVPCPCVLDGEQCSFRASRSMRWMQTICFSEQQSVMDDVRASCVHCIACMYVRVMQLTDRLRKDQNSKLFRVGFTNASRAAG